MKFLAQNWFLIIVIIAAIAVAAFAVFKFFKLPSQKQLEKVKEWLLFAVAAAEKELGSGTGQLKLRYVYDCFVQRFPDMASIITFETFSEMVDIALQKFNNMLKSNVQVQRYVNSEKE